MRRETGKGYVVKVHCDEGLAIHVAPDPCAGAREGVCGLSRGGTFQLQQKTRRDRMRAELKDIKAELRR